MSLDHGILCGEEGSADASHAHTTPYKILESCMRKHMHLYHPLTLTIYVLGGDAGGQRALYDCLQAGEVQQQRLYVVF